MVLAVADLLQDTEENTPTTTVEDLTSNTPSSIMSIEELTASTPSPVEPASSHAQNFAYGFSNATNDMQDLYRILERKGLTMSDTTEKYGKDWEEATDKRRIEMQHEFHDNEMRKQYPEVFASGGDKSKAAIAGGISKTFATPTSLVGGTVLYKTYVTSKNVNKAIKTVKTMGVGGALGAEVSILEQAAHQGNVDLKTVAKVTATSAVLTPVIPAVGHAAVKTVRRIKAGRGDATAPVSDMSNKQAKRVYEEMTVKQSDALSSATPTRDLPEHAVRGDVGSVERADSVNKWMREEYSEILEDADSFLAKAGERSLPSVTSATAVATKEASKKGRRFWGTETGKKLFVSMDFRLERMSPRVAGKLRQMVSNVERNSSNLEDIAAQVSKQIDSLDDNDIVWGMLQDQEWSGLSKMLIASGDEEAAKSIGVVRNILDKMGDELEKSGAIKSKIDNYFPRYVKDREGMLDALGKEGASTIMKALDKARSKQKAPLGQYQESMIINKTLRTIHNKPSGKNEKKRVFDTIPEDLKQFYMSPKDTLSVYMRDAVDKIETAKFFGEFNKKKKKGGSVKDLHVPMSDRVDIVDDSIGNIVRQENLSPSQQEEMKSILNSIFGMGKQHSPKWVSTIKAITYSALLGNIRSTVTQVSDLAGSMQINNFINTAATIASRTSKFFAGKEQMLDVVRDAGIAKMGHEMSDAGAAEKYLKTVMYTSGFRGMDVVGKNVFAEAALRKVWKGANNDKIKGDIYERYGKAWGMDDARRLIKDIETSPKGEPTDLMKEYALNELRDIQPISSISVPQAYADHPTGRLLYTLNTWNIRMLNVQHKRIVQDSKNLKEATTELAKMGIFFGLLDTGGDYIKDIMNGKEVEFTAKDVAIRAGENLKRMLFIDSYMVNKMSKEGAVSAVTDKMLEVVPARVVSDLTKPAWDGARVGWHEVTGNEEAEASAKKDLRKSSGKLKNYAPLAGPQWYNRTERNKEKTTVLGRYGGN